jgi:hypothetical protein
LLYYEHTCIYRSSRPLDFSAVCLHLSVIDIRLNSVFCSGSLFLEYVSLTAGFLLPCDSKLHAADIQCSNNSMIGVQNSAPLVSCICPFFRHNIYIYIYIYIYIHSKICPSGVSLYFSQMTRRRKKLESGGFELQLQLS